MYMSTGERAQAPSLRQRERLPAICQPELAIIIIIFIVNKPDCWLVTPDFLVFLPYWPEPCYTGAETWDEEAGMPPCNPPSQRHLRS